MRVCPFWSLTSEKVECNNECPMYPFENEGEECIFETYLYNVELNYTNLINEGMFDIDEDDIQQIEA
ncbi:hypothetical protein ACFO6R_01800 [Eubacterium multiforme]|uniref:Uncharacterized protein n=1 Tax=Eubacterium multiforme TaxID=83339 RepID=A0ABT9URJ4_9FIRM|nr:hypothetical protein [Eubacterium multiforme]MDQ0148515.1 hypothetical protein [Eubacterium multiforme]